MEKGFMFSLARFHVLPFYASFSLLFSYDPCGRAPIGVRMNYQNQVRGPLLQSDADALILAAIWIEKRITKPSQGAHADVEASPVGIAKQQYMRLHVLYSHVFGFVFCNLVVCTQWETQYNAACIREEAHGPRCWQRKTQHNSSHPFRTSPSSSTSMMEKAPRATCVFVYVIASCAQHNFISMYVCNSILCPTHFHGSGAVLRYLLALGHLRCCLPCWTSPQARRQSTDRRG